MSANTRTQVSDTEKEALIVKLTKALQVQNARVEELRRQHSSGISFSFCIPSDEPFLFRKHCC